MPERAAVRRHAGAPGGTAEDGFSLIELLVTLVIVGSAFVILVGGTLTGVIASNTHREKADGEIALRAFIDHVKAAPFEENCADKDNYRSGFSIAGFDSEVASCTPIVPPADGLQKLRLAVAPTVTGGPAESARLEVDIVKRNETP